ncbi:MAG TPA: hypothetical protein PK990_08515 [Salinivirgaceae bacterium]|nr:hypothetical protein [Salinivirgaceae bacterium]
MIRVFIKNIFRAILLISLQIFVLNNIELGGFINPYLYILIIMLLPIETPGWLLLMISFATGYIIDTFVSTPGMHTMACVATGFLRHHLIQFSAPREGYDPNTPISSTEFGFIWFFRYTLILTVLHHSILFLVESFGFHNFFQTLARIIFSIVFTELLIIVLEYFRSSIKKENYRRIR